MLKIVYIYELFVISIDVGRRLFDGGTPNIGGMKTCEEVFTAHLKFFQQKMTLDK